MKISFLRHSPILFLPLIGTLFYKLENYLYRKSLLRLVFISRKKNAERDKILKVLSSNSDVVVCQTYKLGRILSDIDVHIISDFAVPKSFKDFSLEKLHDLSWTLILSEKITLKTKKSLGDFIPKNFPTVKIENLLNK